MSFADVFAFTRPTAAPFVDAAGVTQVAAAGVPRFDYLAPQRPRGLLVETGDVMGQGDEVSVRPRDWSASWSWTVLHEWEDAAGVRADAHYATDPGRVIDACLSLVGHHRRIAACAGYLPVRDASVWALGRAWALAGFLGGGGGRAIGTELGKPFLAG